MIGNVINLLLISIDNTIFAIGVVYIVYLM